MAYFLFLMHYQKIALLPEDIRQAEEAARMAPKESAADTRRYFLQTAFLQKAVEASKIKVSKKEAEKWAQKMMRAMDQQLANNGEDFKKYYEGTGTTEKELMDEFIKEAELIKKDIAISKGEEYIGTLIDASYN
mgnify:FL=1